MKMTGYDRLKQMGDISKCRDIHPFVISFETYMISIKSYQLLLSEPIYCRRDLIKQCDFDIDRIGKANELWNDYIEWLCNLKPVQRDISFKRWMLALKSHELRTLNEYYFLADLLYFDKFPRYKTNMTLDWCINHLYSQNASDNDINACESLWVRYKSDL